MSLGAVCARSLVPGVRVDHTTFSAIRFVAHTPTLYEKSVIGSHNYSLPQLLPVQLPKTVLDLEGNMDPRDAGALALTTPPRFHVHRNLTQWRRDVAN